MKQCTCDVFDFLKVDGGCKCGAIVPYGTNPSEKEPEKQAGETRDEPKDEDKAPEIPEKIMIIDAYSFDAVSPWVQV